MNYLNFCKLDLPLSWLRWIHGTLISGIELSDVQVNEVDFSVEPYEYDRWYDRW